MVIALQKTWHVATDLYICWAVNVLLLRNINMAYPPPRGDFSYQRAYPPDYEQSPYPPPIGFQNYVAGNPGVPPTQNQPYPPPTTVAYHGQPEPQIVNEPRRAARNEVGFEGFSGRSNPPSAQSASGVELENVEDLPHGFQTRVPEEQLSDNSTSRIEVRGLLVLT